MSSNPRIPKRPGLLLACTMGAFSVLALSSIAQAQLPQGLAVAFIDVNGDDEFTANDHLIAEVVDTNLDGEVSAGDTIHFGVLPLTFEPPLETTAQTALISQTLTGGSYSPPTPVLPGTVEVSWQGQNRLVFEDYEFLESLTAFDSDNRQRVRLLDYYYDTRRKIGDSSIHSAPVADQSAFADLPSFKRIGGSSTVDNDHLDLILGGHTARNGVIDTDGDGVPDAIDECPNSDMSLTIMIDGCDSGVDNPVFENGCTLADIINARVEDCAFDTRNHGGFVRCMAGVLNDLVSEGVLVEDEKDSIQACVGASSIGKPSRGGKD